MCCAAVAFTASLRRSRVSVVVPPGAPPPADDPGLPMCVWALGGAVPGRVARADLAMPVMGVVLADVALVSEGVEVVTPTLAVVGAMNERAYGMAGAGYDTVFAAVRDDRVRSHGLCVDGTLACVAVTLAIEDDVCVHYVATELAYRRRGLASRLLGAVLMEARARGVDISIDRARELTLLFDPEHALDDRITMEQFAA